jgi:hypothetical protein
MLPELTESQLFAFPTRSDTGSMNKLEAFLMFILLTSLFTVSTYVGLKSNSVLCCVLFLIYNDERRDRRYHELRY